ncbi:hypothetical protein E4K10_30360 [Streptomyces sp. T1317-0309]|nr:hypothetical protein E4K10_30360 [Streptomyces sp. T1317-0309]
MPASANRAIGAEHGNCIGRIASALIFFRYATAWKRPGCTDIKIAPPRQVAEGMHSVVLQAVKPRTAQPGEHATTEVSETSPAGVVQLPK